MAVRPSRNPHRISKILFALGADEFLAMREGKVRVTPFFLRFNLVKLQCEYSFALLLTFIDRYFSGKVFFYLMRPRLYFKAAYKYLTAKKDLY